MESGHSKVVDIVTARSSQSMSDLQVRPYKLSHKRRRSPNGEGGDEHLRNHLDKSPQAQETKAESPRPPSHRTQGQHSPVAQASIYVRSSNKIDFIENWLTESCWSRRTSAKNASILQELPVNMPWKQPDPESLGYPFKSAPIEAAKTSVCPSDPMFRDCLTRRNIYIDVIDPPSELMRRARSIISHPQASLDMDDAAVQELRESLRRIASEQETDVVSELTEHFIPKQSKIRNKNLVSAKHKLWYNSVPIPLSPFAFRHHLPLARPKPDLAFGYSKTAFSKQQREAIDVLTDEPSECNNAIPDRKLSFPFLCIEFKSQATGGTHFVATNQVASAGAIALEGYMQLQLRQQGIIGTAADAAAAAAAAPQPIDLNDPQFFSITMDQVYAQINVHWLSTTAPVATAGDGQYCFHCSMLAQHFLADAAGSRALATAIRGILDFGAGPRRRGIVEALDMTYQEALLTYERERAAQEL